MARDKKSEAATIGLMIGLYCRDKHGGAELCRDCAGLRAYALQRLAACSYEPKPACRPR